MAVRRIVSRAQDRLLHSQIRQQLFALTMAVRILIITPPISRPAPQIRATPHRKQITARFFRVLVQPTRPAFSLEIVLHLRSTCRRDLTQPAPVSTWSLIFRRLADRPLKTLPATATASLSWRQYLLPQLRVRSLCP